MMSKTDETELLDLNQRLLDAIDGQDWETYTSLCDETLTAYEPEAVGNLVVGMPFHKFYFEMRGNRLPKQSTISSPNVRLMGDVACVTYVRLVQRVTPEGGTTTTACEETRIWQKQDGNWRHVHFHRSKSGFVQL
jgi:calcium/calmodulin-dependent protein kinase (CaM kinase) II